MPRYIDSKGLMISLSDWWYSSFGLDETEESKAIKRVMDKVEKYIDAQPTADAVKVIRCKDCKYRSKEWFEDKRFKGGGYWLFVCENDNIAERVYGLAHDKDYCSYGERAEA